MLRLFSKIKLPGIIALLIISIAAIYVANEMQSRSSFEGRKQHLDELILSNTNVVSNSSTLIISGSGAVKESIIEIFANDKLLLSMSDANGGEFASEVTLNGDDGIYTIFARQKVSHRKEEASGSNTQAFTITLDRKAPEGYISFTKEVPHIINVTDLEITFDVINLSEETVVVISSNGFEEEVPVIKSVTHKFNLVDGDNVIRLYLQDQAGNKTDVLAKKTVMLDSLAPAIKQTPMSFCFQVNPSIETACLSIGSFFGPNYGWAYAPLTGKILGDLESLYVNRKMITIKPDGTINETVGVYVSQGDNNYDVVAKDGAGNVGYGVLSVSWGEVDDEPALDNESDCYCSSNSYNCDDFSDQYEAQDLYECCLFSEGYDVHDLDRDDDGDACESLP